MHNHRIQCGIYISTTNLAACVCVCAKFDQFLPVRSQFDSNQHVILDRFFLRSIVLFFFLRKQNKE